MLWPGGLAGAGVSTVFLQSLLHRLPSPSCSLSSWCYLSVLPLGAGEQGVLARAPALALGPRNNPQNQDLQTQIARPKGQPKCLGFKQHFQRVIPEALRKETPP